MLWFCNGDACTNGHAGQRLELVSFQVTLMSLMTQGRSYNKDMIWWSTEGTIIQCCLQTETGQH
jgi:hypothetical protein